MDVTPGSAETLRGKERLGGACVLVALVAIALGGCTNASQTRPSEVSNFQSVRIGRVEGVILHERLFESEVEAVPPAGAGGIVRWTPTLSQVERFERGMAEFLRRSNPERFPSSESVSAYRRQYHGVCDWGFGEWYQERHPGAPLKRRCAIVGQFMCEELPNWRSRVVEVQDGERCFFNVWMVMDDNGYTI